MSLRPSPTFKLVSPSDEPAAAPDLQSGDGGGTSSGMEARVTRLETHMEYVRRDLDSIGADVRLLVKRSEELPTKRDLDSWRWQWIATGVAILALVIGGIVGGLALINHYAASGSPSSPQPIVIQVPASVPALPTKRPGT